MHESTEHEVMGSNPSVAFRRTSDYNWPCIKA